MHMGKQAQRRKFYMVSLQKLPCSYFSAKGSMVNPKKGCRQIYLSPSFSSVTWTSPWIPWLLPRPSHPTHTWLSLKQHFWNFPSAQLKILARALIAAVASTSPGLVLIHPSSLCGHQSLSQSCKDHFPKLLFLAHAPLCTFPCQLHVF